MTFLIVISVSSPGLLPRLLSASLVLEKHLQEIKVKKSEVKNKELTVHWAVTCFHEKLLQNIPLVLLVECF